MDVERRATMKKTLFKVENRVIDTIDKTNFTGLLNVDKLEFIFNEEWDDLDKTLVIILGETTLNLAMINDSVVLPPDIYDAEECQIGIFGTKVENGEAKKILTTMPYILPICEGMYKEGEEPSNLPTPTQWDLYITEINRLIEDFNENVINKTAEFDEHVAEEFDELKGNFYTKNQTDTLLGGKQDTLVAGSNITIDPETNTISSHDTTYGNATSETAGLMSASDKTKMDTIASGAQVNVIEKVSVNGTEQTVTNKGVNISVPTNNNQLTNGAGYITKEVDNLTNYMKTGNINTALGLKLDASQKGANGGVAELDNTGKVPSSQLPSYVDDVLEYSSTSAFPATGETGKIYVALDTNKTYRWGGSAYTEISESLALGETSSTAFRGDHGKTAYDHATDPNKIASAQTKGFYKVGVTAEGHIKEVQAVAKADLTGLGVEDASNKVQTISDQSTHAQYPDAKCVYDNFKDRDNTIENISARVNVLEKKDGRQYTIVRKVNDNSSPLWTRKNDAVGLVANARIGSLDAVQNDFDNIYPWSDIKDCNVDSNGEPTHYIGEAGFTRLEEVYVYIPKHWIKRTKYELEEDGVTNTYEEISIYDYNAPDSIEIAPYMVGKYHTAQVSIDNVATHVSLKDVEPLANTTKATYRTKARAKGSKWSLMDWHVFDLQYLYLVEYANYNCETMVGAGFIYGDIATSALAESSVNRVVVSGTLPTGFYVGKKISIGSDRGNYGVARFRNITEINDYSDGNITGKEIVFDGDAVTTTTSSKIWCSPEAGGTLTDLENYSGCLGNDQKHTVSYRGIENLWGNLWQHVDGICIKDGVTYLSTDYENYTNDKFTAPYSALGYTNATTNDKYIKEMGYDTTCPSDDIKTLVGMPTVVGGSSTTYVCDNYWYGSGDKIFYCGGNCSTDGSKSGIFASYCYGGSSGSAWGYGSRLLIHTSQ